MEILYLPDKAIKLKGKSSSFVVDPTKSTKTTADSVLFLQNQETYSLSPDLQSSQRLIIMGAGEYEVGGIKIHSQRLGNDYVYTVTIDSIEVLLVRAEALERAHGKVKSCNIVICQSDQPANPSHLLSLSPSVIVLYGTASSEIAKGLGKESVSPVSKYVTTAEKLPLEMEVVILG